MSFPDKSADSVHSLLALLRSTQADPSSSSSSSSRAPNPNAYVHGNTNSHSSRPPVIPSKSQLDDLLTSLNARSSTSTSSSTKESPNKERNLIEPFGPVGQAPPSSYLPYDAQIRPRVEPPPSSTRRHSGENHHQRRPSTSSTTTTTISPSKKSKYSHPRDRVNEEGYQQLGFGKALPVLTELLEDEGFKKELKKMKADQDALERRLWAKGEKLKAEHERGTQAEREVAKIARKPISSEKKSEWAKSLASSLRTFHADQCLPAIDGLAHRQRTRLVELGVPGLGDEPDEKARERVKRIMDVLEAGMEE